MYANYTPTAWDGFLHRRTTFIPRTSTFNDRKQLENFHFDTLVRLETGETKRIQQMTSNDFAMSAKYSRRYSSLLARLQSVGSIDKLNGKIELHFYIPSLDRTTSFFVAKETPFFVSQHSCWASISPESTRRLCGLSCRPLTCGDFILALIDQKTQPDYSKRSPTKCLVERYMKQSLVTKNSKRLKTVHE